MGSLAEKRGQKSKFWAYFLWFFGGIFGLHHLYLNRDRQAFVWWSTLGGFHGYGWLGDFFRIPKYVRDANEDPEYIATFISKLRKHKKPPYSVNRFLSMILVGYSWGQMYISAIPTREVVFNTCYLTWLSPVAVALGVWTVGNIGREKGTLLWPLIGAYIAFPLRYVVFDHTFWLIIMVAVSALFFDTFSKKWRRTPPVKHSILRRSLVLGACVCIYLSLWASYLYFNGTILDSDDEEIPLREAIHHFFTSPWWVDLNQSLYEVYQYAQHHGWYEVWKEIIDLSDPRGEQNAYKVLGVTPDTSQHEITAIWRKLSKENHPDKVKDDDQRRIAQEKFMEIQQAYEILSNSKHRRNKRNKKDNS